MGDTGGVKRLGPALALLLALTACGSGKVDTVGSAPKPGYHGVEPSPVPTRPSYTLTDTSGKRFDFAAETKGRPTFVYFGYTNCPDECPTAMADLAAALRQSSPEIRDRTRVIFVATDIKRDTAPAVRRFLDQFSTEFIGLIGTKAELDAAQQATGIPVAYPEGPVPTIPGRPDAHPNEPGTQPHKHFGPLGYSVAHSAVIFAYDAADRLPVVYPGGVTPSDITADLPRLTNP